MLLELTDDARNRFRRDREAQPDRASAGRENRRGYADHCPVDRQERAARVAVVDRRVGLQEVDVRVLFEYALPRRDDSRAHGLTQPKWIADRDHGIADGNRFAGSEVKCGQIACRYLQ